VVVITRTASLGKNTDNLPLIEAFFMSEKVPNSIKTIP
jgi:hypothetical protein